MHQYNNKKGLESGLSDLYIIRRLKKKEKKRKKEVTTEHK